MRPLVANFIAVGLAAPEVPVMLDEGCVSGHLRTIHRAREGMISPDTGISSSVICNRPQPAGAENYE